MVQTFGPEPPPGMRPAPAAFDAENAPNHENIEMAFAQKVIQHMETYWKILKNKRGSQLRLTKMDDEIYEHLKADFPELDPAEDIVEDKLKSKEGKERWRKFMMVYEKKVEDFNFGTMLRVSPKDDVDTEERVIFVPRMQFYAFEIARNRAGLNDWVYEQAHPEEKKEDSASG
ncbi:hypothetical protein RB598_009687 [Gaeumannomyces tritici]